MICKWCYSFGRAKHNHSGNTDPLFCVHIFTDNWLNVVQSSFQSLPESCINVTIVWNSNYIDTQLKIWNVKVCVYVWSFSMDFMDWVTLTLVVHHVTVMWVGQSVRRVTRQRGRVLVNPTSLVSSVTSPAQDITTPCWIISFMKLNLPKDLE